MANRNNTAQRATAGATPAVQRAATARSIFVTGASTGIGRATVEYLAARGDHLFAGARSDRAPGELGRLPNVVPVRLDVTQAESVDAAVAHVRGLTDTLRCAGEQRPLGSRGAADGSHAVRLDGSIFAARARAFGRLMLERARTGGRPPATIARAVHRARQPPAAAALPRDRGQPHDPHRGPAAGPVAGLRHQPCHSGWLAMSGFSLDLAAHLQRWAATVSASSGVNSYLFIALTTICAPAFYYSIYRLTKALARQARLG